jgi:type VI secretion system protein ImpL
VKALRWSAIVLVLLLLLGVWIVSIFVPGFRGVAQTVTAVVALLVLGFFLGRWVRARLKAAAIEREMTKQKEPAADPRVAELRAKMQAAVDALKRRRKGSGRTRASLYSLPWYVIVGPAAAGKSTALGRSSLQFIATDDGALKVRGTAGTRNCDWWFSPEAILLDTAGRFATEDNDRDEWMSFLDSLHRFRPDRPLDGLLVAVSVPDILSATGDDLGQLAQKLRARLDEVLGRLEMVLPVYLLLTKTDLVAGFVEFWSDLSKAHRAQVFGASFEVDDPRLAEPARAVEVEFDVLLEGVHARLLDRLPAERSPERRARILQFPVELRALRSPLATFIEALCQPDADGERPLLRGFYLTSGIQVGRPVDRVIASMQRGFDLHSAAPPPKAPGGDEQSYFLSDVFRSVILPDRHLAARSAAGVRRRSTREFVFAAVAVGSAVFVLLPAIVSYIRNTQITGDFAVAARALDNVDAASIPGSRTDPIELSLDTLDRLREEASGFGVAGWFGPRAARELSVPLWKAYTARLDVSFHAGVQKYLDKRVSDIARSPVRTDPTTAPLGTRTSLREDYDDIKLYATLVEPLEHVDLTWTPKRLVLAWQRALAGVDAVEEGRLVRHASEYLTALALDPDLAWTAPKTLAGARESLKRSDAWLLPYNWLLRHASNEHGLVANDVVGAGPSIRYIKCKHDELVPGAYTKNGWRQVQPVLESPEPWPSEAQIEPWVVPDTRIPDDMDTVRKRARERYFDQYVRAWIASSSSLIDACTLSDDPEVCPSEIEGEVGTGFYESLFLLFRDNAIRYEKKAVPASLLTQEGCSRSMPWSNADAGSPEDVQSPVEKGFRPILAFAGLVPPAPDAPKADALPPFQKYQQILRETILPLMPTLSAPRLGEVKGQVQKAMSELEGVLSSVDDSATKDTLRHLLTPPIECPISVINHPAGGPDGGGDPWRTQVRPALQSLLDGYPFNKAPKAHRDDPASFEAFAAFFRPPDGTLGAFLAGPISDCVTLGPDGATAKPGYVVDADLLACLKNSESMMQAFFPTGEERGTKLAILVDWSAPDITDVKFSIGPTVMPLPKGEWSPSLKWAGQQVRLSYTEAGTFQQLTGRGSFSLFDLFDQLGGLTPTVTANYVARSTTLPLTVKVRSESRQDPFSPDFFGRLHCPTDARCTVRP